MNKLNNLYNRAVAEIASLGLNSLQEKGLDRTLDSYYLIGTYPPLLAMAKPTPQGISDLTFTLHQPVDLYLHFPFCTAVGQYECIFCHFYKEFHEQDLEDRYIEACLREMRLYKNLLGEIAVRSIYFGGGSFSLMSPRNLDRLLSFIQREFAIDPGAEIKAELRADAARSPGIMHEQLAILKSFHTTHIVIDIQSLNPETLAASCWNRVRPEDYFETLDACKDLGFQHFVSGLILGLPFDSFESFLHSVIQLGSLPHLNTINLFPLMFRKGDLVYDQLQILPEIFPDVRERDIMMSAARLVLQAYGFVESPIYFFNRGTTADHQTSKFAGNTLLGIGPSAFGTFHGPQMAQYYNVPSLRKYLDLVEQGELPIWRLGLLSEVGQAARQIMFEGINMNRPFDLGGLQESIRERFQPLVEFLVSLGLLKVDGQSFLPTSKGLLRAEEMSYFFAEEEVRKKQSSNAANTIRYNYFITRSPRQEELFFQAFDTFRKQPQRTTTSALVPEMDLKTERSIFF